MLLDTAGLLVDSWHLEISEGKMIVQAERSNREFKEMWELEQTYFFTWPPIDTRADSMFRICPLFTLKAQKKVLSFYCGETQQDDLLRGWGVLPKHLWLLAKTSCGESVCFFKYLPWALDSTEKNNSIKWNVSGLPPLYGILQRYKGLWSTPEEVLHTVQSIHCSSCMQILKTANWCHLSLGLMC